MSRSHKELSVLIIGGAPALRIDALRRLMVPTSGKTAVFLDDKIKKSSVANNFQIELLLSKELFPQRNILRYEFRDELDKKTCNWIKNHPQGLIICSAAVNDYQLERVEIQNDNKRHVIDGKIPSGKDAIHIQLTPAPKLIDQFPAWGHQGKLIACKYEASETVLASAQKLQQRTGAHCVLANSIDMQVQALVFADRVEQFASREEVLNALVQEILVLG